MKRFVIALLMAGMAGFGVARADEPATPNTLVWCGLDYSKVTMIGTMDFRHPEQIFPSMLEKWNELFLKEMLPQLESMAGSVRTDIGGVEAVNEKASADQIKREDGSRAEEVAPSTITEGSIADSVRSYKLTHDQGLGLVFIMDRLVKAQETGCLYVVFFDVASRHVLHSERVCAAGGGMGFRNYWFRPIKTAVHGLPKQYKMVKGRK